MNEIPHNRPDSEQQKQEETGARTEPRQWRKLGWIAFGPACAVVGYFVIAGSPAEVRAEASSSGTGDSSGGIDPVETVVAFEVGGYEVEDRFVGIAEAARSSDLGFELAGTVDSVSAEEGDVVEAGDVLAKLDTGRLEARRAELSALLAQMEAGLALAEKTQGRLEQAVKKQAASLRQADEALERRLNAEAGVNRVRSQIKAIDVDLKKSIMVAPYAGAIALRSVDEGAIAAPGKAVMRLVETSRIEVRAGFSAAAAASVSPGDLVRAETTSGEDVRARVLRVLPVRDLRARTVDVIMSIDGETCGVWPGDLIKVRWTRGIEAAGMWLPKAALTESYRGLWAAYVLIEQADGISNLERRQVEVLEGAGDKVFVRGAIEDGSKVVACGVHRLAPGQLVREIAPA